MKKKYKNLLSIIAFIIILIIAKLYMEKLQENDRNLTLNGKVTVGLIIQLETPGAKTISGNSYHYYYFVDSVKYFGYSFNDIKYKIGSYFEVFYLVDKPTKSKMNFSKPVKPENVCNYFKEECPFSK